MLFYKYLLPLLLWANLILVLSLLPSNKLPSSPFNGVDLLVHIIFYFLLSFLMARALFFYHPFKKYFLLLSITFSITLLFGAGIEVIQEYFILSRTGQWIDVFANAFGSLVGLIWIKILYG